MRVRHTLLLIVGAFAVGGDGLFAQSPNSVSNAIEPNPADFEVVAEEMPPDFANVPAALPSPAAPLRQFQQPNLSPETRKYRDVIEALSQDRHQFVHCKLKSGKVLTGLLRDVGDGGFTLRTEALAGSYITYESLAEPPEAVLAVGTRIKQGVEWAGVGALVAVAVPVIIVLSPLLFAAGWRC